MDWLRRNWPDLIIGLALIAVMAGIVVTLLGGGVFWPFGARPNAAPPPAAVAPAMPPATPALPLDDVVIPVLPGLGGETPAPVPAPTQPETQPEIVPVVPRPAVAAPPPGIAPQPAPAAVAPTEASYRISVAAVRNPEGADRLRAELSNQGFPAFIGRQGELYLVLVGPYRTRAEADQVAARLRAAGQETFIFFFPGGTPAPAPAAPAPAAPAPAAPAPPAAAPAEGELRFLQVGAYATIEGARPQIERLQALGYTVTQRRTEGGLIRLLIGPFNPSELLTARNRLTDQGIEHFVTR